MYLKRKMEGGNVMCVTLSLSFFFSFFLFKFYGRTHFERQKISKPALFSHFFFSIIYAPPQSLFLLSFFIGSLSTSLFPLYFSPLFLSPVTLQYLLFLSFFVFTTILSQSSRVPFVTSSFLVSIQVCVWILECNTQRKKRKEKKREGL